MSEAIEQPEILDPEKVEAEMLAAAEAKANDPTEQAAQLFKAYTNSYQRAIKKLSSKQMRRLLQTLVLSPLEKTPALVSQEEHEAFFYGDSMLQAKFIMGMKVYMDSAQEIEAMQKEIITETVYGDEAVALQKEDDAHT